MFLMYFKLGKFIDSFRNDLSKLTGEVNTLTRDVSDVKEKIIDTMDLADKVVAQSSNIVDNVKIQSDRLNDAINPLINLVNGFYHRIAPPVRQSAGVIAGVSKAINTFFDKTTQKKLR